jgi:hypothetical protein
VVIGIAQAGRATGCNEARANRDGLLTEEGKAGRLT